MNRHINIIMMVAVLATVFVFVAVPVKDPDFFWHIANGRWIAEHGRLPDTDPFTFTSMPEDPTKQSALRIRFILRSYWLAQIIFYAIYKFSGYGGLVLFRAAILTLAAFFMYLFMKQRGIPVAVALIISLFAGIYLDAFDGLRPQIFTFTFSVLAVLFLEGMLEPPAGVKRRLYFIGLPLLMLLWSNLHGGWILGAVIISICIFAEAVMYIYRRRRGEGPVAGRMFFAVASLSLLAGLANPETWHAFAGFFVAKSRLYHSLVTEYMTPMEAARSLHEYLPQFWTFLAAGTVVHILKFRHIPLRRHLVFVLLAVMGLSAIRYSVFLVLIEPLFLSLVLEPLWERLRKPPGGPEWKRLAASGGVIALSLSLMVANIAERKASPFGVNTRLYPAGAVGFIKNNNIRGNMFNIYDWGGYLIWELYPGVKVFHDGRGLVEELVFDAGRVLGASSVQIAGMPEWRGILDGWGVDMLLIRGASQFGQRIHRLVPVLQSDPAWALVYFDDLSLLYLRRARFPDIANRAELPGHLAYNQIIAQLGRVLGTHPYMKQAWVSMAEAHYLRGQKRSAVKFYRRALELDPSDRAVRDMLERIERSLAE